MKKFTITLILVGLFSVFVSINITSAENNKSSKSGKMFVPGLILVKFEEQAGNLETSTIFNHVVQKYHVEKADQLFPDQKFKSSPKRKIIDLSRIYRLHLPESSDIESICANLNNKSGVVYAEPVYILKIEEEPNDPHFPQQTHLPQIMAPEAWDVVKGDSTVIIGIVDTGVDWNHPDLAARIWNNSDEVLDGTDTDGNGYPDDIRGWDWVDGATDAHPDEDIDVADNDPMDFDGHGTHCSGIAAAITNNEIGVASVSYNCTIMPLRVGWLAADGINGYVRSDWSALAFRYAADNGAHVINLSAGNQEVVADAARYAFAAGVVTTSSAGNGDNEDGDPLENQAFNLTTAAVDDRDYKASYSNYGDWIKVSAPGGDPFRGRPPIFSTIFDDIYGYMQGTSQAAPVVAGLAGLLKSQHPEWSNADIFFQIINTADNIDHLNPGYENLLGSGRINAYRAVTEPLTEPSPEIIITNYSVDDSDGGDGNGIADAGEQLEVIVEFLNNLGTAYNASANLNINDWAIEIVKGQSNFGDIPGLRDIENSRVNNSADPFIIKIDPLALPREIEGTIELTADDGYAQTFDFSFAISASVLLVDDEDLHNEQYYIDALDSLGITYTYWDHNINGTPPDLSAYSTVIWSCEWTFPSLDSADRAVVADYLDNGGNFFLSGQDIGWDLCDQTVTNNEYFRTAGASLTFYENYLKARYIGDDSDFSSLIGVAGDPIGDGLSFNIFQPERGADQYPSEVEPLDGAISIFNYPDDISGAVRYANTHRSVYFAFGGYEAIIEPDVRLLVMNRVLNWLNGLKVHHIPVKDTEDTNNDYAVEVYIETQAQPVGKVELFWDTDGELPYANKETMTDMGNGRYEGYISAQPTDTDVQYSLFVQTVSGYYSPINFYSFYVGEDTEAPVFESVQLNNTMNKALPYRLQAVITDNAGLNTNSVYLHYTAGSVEDSVKMLLGLEPDLYNASIQGDYHYGDTIKFYITAEDIASSPNKATSNTHDLVIGLDNFESGLVQWEPGENGWGIESGDAYSGENYVSDSPGRNYIPGAHDSLQLKMPLDLAKADSAVLYFYTKYKLQPVRAYGYVEVSIDNGDTWVQVGDEIGGARNSWAEKEYSLTEYVGLDNVLLRFRLETDPAGADRFDGWLIDDVRIVEKASSGVSSNNFVNSIPTEFKLSQNFPNPFNPETSISYQLSASGKVTMKIYNTMGQMVRTLVNANKPAGNYKVTWNGKDNNGFAVSSGIYFYQMRAKDFVQTRKMLFLK